MFIHSIRWRLQIWLAFLLACVLIGFGATAYQLYYVRQLDQIDAELSRRVSALTSAVRGPGPESFPPGRGGFDAGGGNFDRGGRGFDRGGGFRRGDGGRGSFDGFPNTGEDPDFNADPNSFPSRGRGDRSGEPGRGRSPRGMGPSRRNFDLTSELVSLFPSEGPEAYYFTVWSRGGNRVTNSAFAPLDALWPAQYGRDTGTHLRSRGSMRECFHFTEMGDCVLAGRDITSDLEATHRIGWLLAGAGGTILAFGLGSVGWIINRAIRPLDEMSATAQRISAGNLSERIQAARTDDELGRLADVLNSTFARLEAAFSRQRQFTADAAHELRTPIAVLISEAQTTLARKRTGDEYKQAVEITLGTAQQMKRLTESLLELAAADDSAHALQRSRADLADLARECAERIRPLAVERHAQVECDLESAEAVCDPDRMRQVITNLLANAVNYNRPQGQIRIATQKLEDSAQLVVADNGIGIGPDDLPHVFERFYRADKARSRSEGHSGLGLAICKSIVEDAGGKIEVTSEPGRGTTFTVTLPLPPAEPTEARS